MNGFPVPPRSRELPPARLQERKEALMQQIREENVLRKSSRRRRAIAILIPAALLSVAATGYAVWSADDVVASGIGCYSSASTDSNVTILPTESGDPIEACGQVWARGDVTGSPESPSLTACINHDGGVSVFPMDDSCAGLGLEPLPEGYREEARRFAQLSDGVHRHLYRAAGAGGTDPKQACLDEPAALDAVRSALDESGFEDWTTEVRTGDYGDRHCMNAMYIDYPAEKVWVVPSEPGIIPWHTDPKM
jgi:hypothetical protein